MGWKDKTIQTTCELTSEQPSPDGMKAVFQSAIRKHVRMQNIRKQLAYIKKDQGQECVWVRLFFDDTVLQTRTVVRNAFGVNLGRAIDIGKLYLSVVAFLEFLGIEKIEESTNEDWPFEKETN